MRDRSRTSTGELKLDCTCNGRQKQERLAPAQEVSSASGKFYAMMQQDGRPSEGADLQQVAGSALPRLGADSSAHEAG